MLGRVVNWTRGPIPVLNTCYDYRYSFSIDKSSKLITALTVRANDFSKLAIKRNSQESLPFKRQIPVSRIRDSERFGVAPLIPSSSTKFGQRSPDRTVWGTLFVNTDQGSFWWLGWHKLLEHNVNLSTLSWWQEVWLWDDCMFGINRSVLEIESARSERKL